MKLRHTCLAAAIVALALACSGCAVHDQSIHLGYAPLEQSFGRHSGEIAVSRQENGPGRRTAGGEYVVGSYNNVHGVPQAGISSPISIGEWITDALLLELKHAGYTATYVSQLPPSTPRAVVISDMNAFLNVNRGTVTDETSQALKFDIDLMVNNNRIKTFSIASRDRKTVPLSASREELERIMLQSLQDAMRQIIPSITGEFSKK